MLIVLLFEICCKWKLKTCARRGIMLNGTWLFAFADYPWMNAGDRLYSPLCATFIVAFSCVLSFLNSAIGFHSYTSRSIIAIAPELPSSTKITLPPTFGLFIMTSSMFFGAVMSVNKIGQDRWLLPRMEELLVSYSRSECTNLKLPKLYIAKTRRLRKTDM